MPKLPAFSRSRTAHAVLFLLTAFLALSCAFGQSSSGGDPNTSGGGGDPSEGGGAPGAIPRGTPNQVGYGSIADGVVPSSTFSFLSGMTSGTVNVIPFAFDELGFYSPTSVNLLLSSSTGTADRADFSLKIFSTLPTGLSLPTALTTFSATGSIGSSLGIYTFTADLSPTLTADTTYYLGVTYLGSDAVDWNQTAADFAATGGSPVTDTFADQTSFGYHTVTADGVVDFTDNVGGFSITANAVSAVPEPATVGAVAASSVLALALFVRWGRRRTAASAQIEPAPAETDIEITSRSAAESELNVH